MDWGMENRIAKLIKPESGRAVWLAIDHGYFLGAVSKLEKPGETVKPLLAFADAIMLTRGVLRNCIDAKNSPAVILRVSGGNSI
ncbi:MAG: 3-hydroxy-5-phosphonooxypentane-2,4-dione thiolase LsrF, partial [Candidatus Omnitrophica bacterium]|nr:3-hydroxy-5-phosphonooxypentane-2,4-dione thiolase LsrF [Candidatus Omnitrophota bacterium]